MRDISQTYIVLLSLLSLPRFAVSLDLVTDPTYSRVRRCSSGNTPMLDICAQLHTNLSAILPQSTQLVNDAEIDECVCMSNLLTFLGSNSIILNEMAQSDPAIVQDAFLSSIIDTGERCIYPPHSVAACTEDSACGFTCTDGYSLIKSGSLSSSSSYDCACQAPRIECNGRCGYFPEGCPASTSSSDTSSNESSPTSPFSSAGPDHANSVNHLSPPNNVCPNSDETACQAFPYGGPSECININTSSEQCGGCLYSSPFSPRDRTPGTNCLEMDGVREASCQKGRCVVENCEDGYEVSPSMDSCVSTSAEDSRNDALGNPSGSSTNSDAFSNTQSTQNASGNGGSGNISESGESSTDGPTVTFGGFASSIDDPSDEDTPNSTGTDIDLLSLDLNTNPDGVDAELYSNVLSDVAGRYNASIRLARPGGRLASIQSADAQVGENLLPVGMDADGIPPVPSSGLGAPDSGALSDNSIDISVSDTDDVASEDPADIDDDLTQLGLTQDFASIQDDVDDIQDTVNGTENSAPDSISIDGNVLNDEPDVSVPDVPDSSVFDSDIGLSASEDDLDTADNTLDSTSNEAANLGTGVLSSDSASISLDDLSSGSSDQNLPDLEYSTRLDGGLPTMSLQADSVLDTSVSTNFPEPTSSNVDVNLPSASSSLTSILPTITASPSPSSLVEAISGVDVEADGNDEENNTSTTLESEGITSSSTVGSSNALPTMATTIINDPTADATVNALGGNLLL